MTDEYLPTPHLPGMPSTRNAEDADYINDLNPALPAGSERIGKGDDHIRVIKSSTLGTFKNFIGIQNFVKYTTTDLNNLKLQINGIAGKTYYIPQKTIYDAAPTASYDDAYAFIINNSEVVGFPGQRVISTKKSLPPLGEIFATILTEKKLNELYGITYSGSIPNNSLIFKVCDGGNIASSKYGQLFGQTTVPDFKTKGSFLAYLDDEPINTSIVSKSYPKNITYRASYDITLLNNLIQNDSGHNHTQYNGIYPSRVVNGGGTAGDGGGGNGANSFVGNTMQVIGIHIHTFTPSALLKELPNPATETRPNNIEINYVMRIN